MDARTTGTFYKAVVKVVLLFGSEMWLMTPQIGRTLGGFQHRVARQLAGIQPQKNVEGVWEYQPFEQVMLVAGLKDVDMYVLHLQNTIAKYIATRPILEMCLEAER